MDEFGKCSSCGGLVYKGIDHDGMKRCRTCSDQGYSSEKPVRKPSVSTVKQKKIEQRMEQMKKCFLTDSNKLRDEKHFTHRLNEVIALVGLTSKDVAHQWNVSLPTVDRWRSGASAPTPPMRPIIHAWLDTLEQEHSYGST